MGTQSKNLIIIGALCSLLVSNSSLACCSGILNTALAILSELSSAGTAYREKLDATTQQQKNAYMTQAVGYGLSAMTLFFALSCTSKGGIHAGFGASLAAYLRNTDKNLLAKMSFYSGAFGISTQLITTFAAILMRYSVNPTSTEEDRLVDL